MAVVHPLAQETAVFSDSGQLYRLIAETIPLMVWTASADGGVEFVNRRVLEYTGLQAHQLVGWGWDSIVHPDDRERSLATWTSALQAGERSENEMRLRRADGVYRWHRGSGAPLRDSDGRVIRWFGVCADIEDQVRSGEILEATVEERTRALRGAQDRLRAIIDNEPECVKLLDAQGLLLEMNAAGLRMIEADSAAEVLGKCVYGVIAPDHIAAFRDLVERVCRGERGSLEFELVGLKGTRRWMETHAVPFRDEASGAARLLAITRDITERSRLEEALRESERRFRTFMDHSPAAAWIKDAGFRYTYVNRALEAVQGRSANDILGRDDFELFPADIAHYFRSDDENLLRDGAAVQRLRQFPHADGSPGHWLVVKFPFADAFGKTGLAGIALDLTPRVEAEEKARQYAEGVRHLIDRVVQAQESERRRLADDLHDLIGQNLTALGIELGTLEGGLSTQDKRRAARRLAAMRKLVSDTVDAIRGVMTGLRPPALGEYGLVAALRWHVSEFSERTGMKATLSVSGRESRLPEDRELALFRIVQEALTNAAKHSGGKSVHVALAQSESGIAITIEDDGSGFADRAGARSAQRGGWGLPAMRERAEAHGGTLRIEFPAGGTKLIVELPARHGD